MLVLPWKRPLWKNGPCGSAARTIALPWKSGPSGPRKARSSAGFTPGGRVCSAMRVFPCLLELRPQRLEYLPDGALIPTIPAPLPLLGSFDQPRLCQDSHVVRDSGLRQADAFFDLSPAQARALPRRRFTGCLRRSSTIFEGLQNPAPGGVCDGVKRSVERCIRGCHGWNRNNARIDKCQCKNRGFLFTTPSPLVIPTRRA